MWENVTKVFICVILRKWECVVTRKAGKNDIKIFPWGVRVWIAKKELIRATQYGALIGGLVIPSITAKFVVGALGIEAPDLIKHGVVFDINLLSYGLEFAAYIELLKKGEFCPPKRVIRNVKWQ